MYLVILTLPLLAAAVAGFLGRKIGRTGSHLITCGSLIITASLALVAFYEVGLCHSPVSVKLMNWIDSEFLFVSWGFIYDSLTVSMSLPVLLVSALVHIYSIGYMSEDPHNQRFFSYLSIFTFFMLMLVSGDNYMIMFIGWEGVAYALNGQQDLVYSALDFYNYLLYLSSGCFVFRPIKFGPLCRFFSSNNSPVYVFQYTHSQEWKQ